MGQALSRSCHGDGDDCVGGDARDGGKRDWGVVGSGGGSCAKLKTTNDQLEIAVDVAENAKIVAENRKVIAEKATASEKKAKDELAIAKQTVDHFLYCDRILLVWKYLQAGDTAQAKASHKECDELHRKFEWYQLKNRLEPEVVSLGGHKFPVQFIAFSPDSLQVAWRANDFSAVLWNMRLGAAHRQEKQFQRVSPQSRHRQPVVGRRQWDRN